MLGVFLINKQNSVNHASSVVRYLAFFLYWYLLLRGAASGKDLPVVALGLALAVPAVFFSQVRAADLRLLLLVLCLGPVIDALLIKLNLLIYRGWSPSTQLAPLWIYACWANFALMANHGLQSLFGKPLHAALIGAFAGPAAFALGVYWGAAQYTNGAAMPSLVLAIGWAALMAVIFRAPPRALRALQTRPA